MAGRNRTAKRWSGFRKRTPPYCLAGLISVGGSTRAWQSMALEGLQATMFTTDMKVVDMLLATRVPGAAQCLLDDELIARAHKMGENIMKAVATPVEERTWLGDEDMGWCPNCHSNALVLGEMQWDGLYYPVECQVCGAGGNLEQTEDGKWNSNQRQIKTSGHETG